MASESRVLYIGCTNDLVRRVCEHKLHTSDGFTHRYYITKLVYYEVYDTAYKSIRREKILKGWRRSKKVALIASMNPQWEDLYYIDHEEFIYLQAVNGRILHAVQDDGLEEG